MVDLQGRIQLQSFEASKKLASYFTGENGLQWFAEKSAEDVLRFDIDWRIRGNGFQVFCQ
jgi:hypothetical protein